jgi:hypothetical protein
MKENWMNLPSVVFRPSSNPPQSAGFWVDDLRLDALLREKLQKLFAHEPPPDVHFADTLPTALHEPGKGA